MHFDLIFLVCCAGRPWSFGQPVLQVGQSGDILETGGIIFEAQYASHVHQFELGFIDLRQV